MIDDFCILKALRLRYSFPRIQWLLGTMSLVSLLYLTSEELWKIIDSEPFPEVTTEGIIYYVLFFLVSLVLVHYYDTKKIVERSSIAILASLISVGIDICLISLSELIVLSAIQVLPQNISKTVIMILIGAMPSSLGAIVLTSLTAETLRKRAKRLFEEAQAIRQKAEKLEEQRKMAAKRLKSLEKRKREFEDYLRKQAPKDKDRGRESEE